MLICLPDTHRNAGAAVKRRAEGVLTPFKNV